MFPRRPLVHSCSHARMTSTLVLVLVSVYLVTVQAFSGNPTPSTVPPPREWQFHVAPMQCYTHAPLRQLYRTLSANATLWTEMEKVEDLLATGSKGLERRFGRYWTNRNTHASSSQPENLVLQIGGNQPDKLRECLLRLSAQSQDQDAFPFTQVNLNCGCPGIEAGGATTYGASLMKQPDYTGTLLQTMRDVLPSTTKVSLKCRIGVVDTPADLSLRTEATRSGGDAVHDTTTVASYQALHRYVSIARDAGVSHVILHARVAVLTGLSPSKNRIVPSLDYRMVERIATDFPDLRVTLNGGIRNLGDLQRLRRFTSSPTTKTTCTPPVLPENSLVASHMAGRWMLRRPLDLAAVQDYFDAEASDEGDGKPGKHIGAVAAQALERYVDYVTKETRDASSAQPLADLCLPLYLVTEQLREEYDALVYGETDGMPNEWDPQASSPAVPFWSEDEMVTMYNVLVGAMDEMEAHTGKKRSQRSSSTSSTFVNFKRLSSSFKGLVGTKVVNKWKRNRAEL